MLLLWLLSIRLRDVSFVDTFWAAGFVLVAFAQADMRDNTGWKAQLEAAERLARNGVLDPNQLLGLYTEEKAAASGGVWDRVASYNFV